MCSSVHLGSGPQGAWPCAADPRLAPVRNIPSCGRPLSAGELRTTGMLVVDSVVPGTPADGVIEAGDVLCCVNGQVVTHFLTLGT